MRRAYAGILAVLLGALSARATAEAPTPVGEPGETDCATEVARVVGGARAATAATDLPARGRAIGGLGADACRAILRSNGVGFDELSAADAPGVAQPIRLRTPIGGVRVESRGGDPSHEIVDCRLAVALLAWMPELRAAGISAALHYSTYREGARVRGRERVSGHARGLAIDLAVLEGDGAPLDVLDGWSSRERGRPPCYGEFEEPERSATLRRLVCRAVEADLFQVVLTPHYDDAHANHVHLEVVPQVTWSYVR
ncbi:MAG: extensin family protein [Sandaracinaceae bacterium]